MEIPWESLVEHRQAINDYLSQAHPEPSLLVGFSEVDLADLIHLINQAFIAAKDKIMLMLLVMGIFATLISFFWIREERT